MEYRARKKVRTCREDNEEDRAGGKTRDKEEDHRAAWSFSFRDLSPWVFLRVRSWIDSLCRGLFVPDRDDDERTTWRTRAVLSRSATTTTRATSHGARVGRRVAEGRKFPEGPSCSVGRRDACQRRVAAR